MLCDPCAVVHGSSIYREDGSSMPYVHVSVSILRWRRAAIHHFPRHFPSSFQCIVYNIEHRGAAFKLVYPATVSIRR
jgi:hypothetical protein